MFNWCYFPLEQNELPAGIQNPLPGFLTINGSPWSSHNGWFNGDGASTCLLTPWDTNPLLFDGIALPKDGSYLIGFQLGAGAPSPDPNNRETILFCGYCKAGIYDGIQVGYRSTGSVRFTLQCRSLGYSDVVVETGDVSNRVSNIFCHIDHRPAGTGVNATFTHTYEDGTDVKSSSYIYDLSNLGDIYPQNINSSTAIIVGAHQNNGNPTFGTYFLGKIRRLHIMHFGRLSNDQPGNLAELMNELSKANMVPTQAVQQVMAFNNQTLSRSFVQYT